MIRFLTSIRAAASLVLFFTLLLGGVYTYMVTGAAQALFRGKANGGLIERGDTIYGSRIIGQQFESPRYFWGRISALPTPYNPSDSGGSNFGVNNPKAVAQANTRIAALQKADPKNEKLIPVDLVTASGSGLDPHISAEAAQYQLSRVARARGIKEDDVKKLIEKSTHSSLFGFLGDEYVNVVTLNLALDEMGQESKQEGKQEGKKEKR